MGQVWEDQNKDGIKDENERRLQDVEVLLFNNQTGTLVTDETGNILKAITDKDGNYTFSKIKKENIQQYSYMIQQTIVPQHIEKMESMQA